MRRRRGAPGLLCGPRRASSPCSLGAAQVRYRSTWRVRPVPGKVRRSARAVVLYLCEGAFMRKRPAGLPVRWAPGDPAGRSSRGRGGGQVLRVVVLPGGAALAARPEVILCGEDIRRVDSVVVEDKVVTQDVVKDETEVGVRRWWEWRLGKTRHKLRSPRKRSRPGYCAGGHTPEPLRAGRRCAGTWVPPTWRRWRPFTCSPSL